MVLSQYIARVLEEMLEESGGDLSIVRNDIALRFGCVPSQINYVISSRFTPERGYLVESRRGGGGFVRIRKIPMGKNEYLMRFFYATGASLDGETARVYLSELVKGQILSLEEAGLVSAALSERALASLPRGARESVRAEIFRNVILELLDREE